METRESVNRLPEHLENDIALFNPKKKSKKLGSITISFIISFFYFYFGTILFFF